jgi:hypothetical protein
MLPQCLQRHDNSSFINKSESKLNSYHTKWHLVRTHLLETAFLYQDLLIPWPPENQKRSLSKNLTLKASTFPLLTWLCWTQLLSKFLVYSSGFLPSSMKLLQTTWISNYAPRTNSSKHWSLNCEKEIQNIAI